jgi:hypothetical protein
VRIVLTQLPHRVSPDSTPDASLRCSGVCSWKRRGRSR